MNAQRRNPSRWRRAGLLVAALIALAWVNLAVVSAVTAGGLLLWVVIRLPPFVLTGHNKGGCSCLSLKIRIRLPGARLDLDSMLALRREEMATAADDVLLDESVPTRFDEAEWEW